MPRFLREQSMPVLVSVLLHGLLAAGLVLVSFLANRRDPVSLQPLPIDAVVVDSQVLHAAQQAKTDRADQEIAQARAAEEAKAAAASAAQAEAEPQMPEADAAAEQADAMTAADAKAAADAEAAKDDEAAQAADLAAAAKAAGAVKAAEATKEQMAAQVRQRAEAAAAAEEAQRVALVAAAKKIQEAKRAAEAKEALDAKKVAVARQAADARQAAEIKQAADAKKAVDDRAKHDREAELRRQIADEEHRSAVEAGPGRERYVALLRNRIQQAWIKPPSASAGIDCQVEVTQVPGGVVTGAHVTQCNGDAAVRQSIENAVYRASPLPDPPDPALFERNFVFRFRPNE